MKFFTRWILAIPFYSSAYLIFIHEKEGTPTSFILMYLLMTAALTIGGSIKNAADKKIKPTGGNIK